jgi:FtsH-binding integral membrane protein
VQDITPAHETIYSGPPLEPRPPRIAPPSEQDLQQVERDLSRFMVHVFAWIAGALLISAFFASYSDRYEGDLSSLLVGQSLWFVIGAMMALAYFVSRKVADMPVSVAIATLIAYASLQGVVFGLLYRGVYGASLAPVYVCIAFLFSLLGIYGFSTGADLTGRPLLLAAISVPVLVLIFKRALNLELMGACAACVCSWLLLSLVGYHRDFLRDLPASFEDDVRGEKAAAVGALQIYLDLVIVMIIVLQARWIRQSIIALYDRNEGSKKIDL